MKTPKIILRDDISRVVVISESLRRRLWFWGITWGDWGIGIVRTTKEKSCEP